MGVIRALAASIISACVLEGGAWAQTYPDRPITMVVAFPPGGADDAIARILHDPMEKALGQSRQLSFHTWGNSGLEPYSGSGNRLSSNRQDPPRDLSLKLTAICILDRTGKVEREGVVTSDPETKRRLSSRIRRMPRGCGSNVDMAMDRVE